MEKLNFNHGWTFCNLQTGETKIVSIPHDAMLAEPRSADNPGRGNNSWFAGGIYSYSKEFLLPEAAKDQRVFFEFEGVYHHAKVYINGSQVSYRPFGYTQFYVDANPHLKVDQPNEIKVVVSNDDQPNSRWYSGSGIYRPVHLYLAELQHILLNGVKIKTIATDPATIDVQVNASAAGKITIEILDADEKIVQSVETQSNLTAGTRIEIPDAKLWSVDTPVIYHCRVTFGSDVAVEEFGIRLLDISPTNGFRINGQRVIMRGACIHHDNGILGACCYPEAEERKIRILKENGYNAIRSAHNPCSKALLRACDHLGMLVMDEYVDVWYIHKTRYDYATYMLDWWRQDLKDMVDKDFNHPSVVLYSTGNEVAETAQPKGIELAGQLTEYLHELDDSRPVTCGINIFFNLLSSMGFGVYSDEKAAKLADEKIEVNQAVGSEFYNKLAGLFGDRIMKIGATLPGCGIKTKDAYANMDIAGYNYGIRRYRHDLKKYPSRMILGSETFCKDAAAFWALAQKNPRIIGDFVWAGLDYLGEVGIGAWEYEDYAPGAHYGPGWITAGSGRIDLCGNPLGEAGYTQVAFACRQDPVIAVRPMNHAGKHSPSAWKMTNARTSWTWDGCEGKTAYIEVYARSNTVELYKNDQLLGRRKIGRSCRVLFKTIYTSGTLRAVAYDRSGTIVGTNELKTAEAKTILLLSPEKSQVRPDEIVFVPIRYTDEQGTVKPTIRSTVQVTVTGGRLIALGNACPFNARGYLQNETDTYYGEALAVVLAEKPGEIVITAVDSSRKSTKVVNCSENLQNTPRL